MVSGWETGRGTSKRERGEEPGEGSRHASERDRATEPWSRIDRPAENYPLAGDFAVCERPITYDRVVSGVLSRGGPTRIPPVPHARRGTHSLASVHRRRDPRTSSTSPSTRSACTRACIWGCASGSHRSTERSEVRRPFRTCIRNRVAFCISVLIQRVVPPVPGARIVAPVISTSCTVWCTRIFRSDVSSRSRTIDGTRRGCCWVTSSVWWEFLTVSGVVFSDWVLTWLSSSTCVCDRSVPLYIPLLPDMALYYSCLYCRATVYSGATYYSTLILFDIVYLTTPYNPLATFLPIPATYYSFCSKNCSFI